MAVRRKDFDEIKEYMRALSELSGNMSRSMSMPKRPKKGSDEKFDAIVACAVGMQEHFSLMQSLLKDLDMIIELKEE